MSSVLVMPVHGYVATGDTNVDTGGEFIFVGISRLTNQVFKRMPNVHRGHFSIHHQYQWWHGLDIMRHTTPKSRLPSLPSPMRFGFQNRGQASTDSLREHVSLVMA